LLDTNSGLGQTFPATCEYIDGVSEFTGHSTSSVLGQQHNRQATQTVIAQLYGCSDEGNVEP
jgi:hypothetical protein